VVLAIVAVGCGVSSSDGKHDRNPLASAGTGGSTSAGMGGSDSTAGMGTGAQGGTMAATGTGGSATGSAGKSTEASGSGGTEPGNGGSGASGGSGGNSGSRTSAGTGGGTADGGTSGVPSAGTGGTMAGTAGMDMGQAGEGPTIPDAPTKVSDPDATGDGPCASKTARDVLDAIHAAYPDFADVTDFPDPRYFGVPNLVYPYTSDAGFSMVLARGTGDCPGGCMSWRYWYFQTDASCEPHEVGSYSDLYGPGNCFTVAGEPMWGMPDHTPTPDTLCPP